MTGLSLFKGPLFAPSHAGNGISCHQIARLTSPRPRRESFLSSWRNSHRGRPQPRSGWEAVKALAGLYVLVATTCAVDATRYRWHSASPSCCRASTSPVDLAAALSARVGRGLGSLSGSWRMVSHSCNQLSVRHAASGVLRTRLPAVATRALVEGTGNRRP